VDTNEGSVVELLANMNESTRIEEACMSKTENEKRTPVLDPIDRVSEIIFGLIMALTFSGTLSAATAGREEVRTMMFTALGCNLAWGMVDAVMYLIRTLTERARNLTLLRQVRSAANPHDAHAIITRELPGRLGRAIVWKASANALRPCPGYPSVRASGGMTLPVPQACSCSLSSQPFRS
jgi:hypothetical protein